MAQSSAPISQGTTAERQFTDAQWRDRFGDEPGVLSDMDGTAYALTVSGADTFSVGSATQASLATVAGFVHRIPAGSPEPVTIPAAVGATRTDIIALRYDPTYTGAPGPVRLAVISGSSSAIPSYDSSPPGVEELPLFAVTRVAGQTLAQATILRMYPRLAPTIGVPVGAVLPTSSPLDTVAWQGTTQYRRLLSGSTPAWSPVVPVGADIPFTAFANANGWTARSATTSGYEVVNRWACVNINFARTSWSADQLITTLPVGVRPTRTRYYLGQWNGTSRGEIRVETSGQIIATNAYTSGSGIVSTVNFPVA